MDDAPAPAGAGRTRRAGRIGLLVLLLVGLAATLRTPAAPAPADAPPTAFSAVRATTHVEAVAARPRTPGSAGHAEAREYLVRILDDLGWSVRVDDGVGWSATAVQGTQRGGRVANVVATLPGTDPTGTVVLAAHYDTVAGSPGAGDDGIGIATVLEAARALTAGPRPRNDVTVLVTDGEERGLLGAEEYTRRQPADARPTVVLNHEARGNGGIPVTFRISSPNAGLVGVLSGVPGTTADSFTQTAFELLPNDTDFRRLTEAGMHAADTAIAGGGAYYHSPLDTPDRLDTASLQRMGETTLAAAQRFSSADLAELGSGGDDVVVTLPWGPVHYPRPLEIALTALLAAVTGALAARRIRDGAASAGRLAASGGISIAVAAAAAGAAFVPWWLALRIAPGQASAVLREPYLPVPYQVAAAAAAVAVLLAAYPPVRRRVGPAAFATGALLAVTVTALAALPFLGVATVLVLPALPAAIAALVVDLLPTDRRGWRTPVTLAGTVPAVVVLVPAAVASFDAGLLTGAPLAGVFVAVLFALALPLVDAAGAPSQLRLAAIAAAGVVLVAAPVGGWVNRDGATPPRQEQLLYALNADTGAAVWASPRAPASAWSRALLPEEPATLPDAFPWRSETRFAHGPAPVAPLPAPGLAVVADVTDGDERTLTLRLTSPRGAPTIGLWVDGTSAAVREAVVAGRSAAPAASFGFLFSGTPAEGIEVRLTVAPRDGAVVLHVADVTDDLTVVPGYTAPENRAVVTPAVTVTRTVRL
ncbi:peptidase, M20/M25/M40 family [Rhodococcus aetherivorans]|uniref:Peptidase, M20/M25/M40 family n=1 Tax=Rhodococcus aetherivorans TaxID=191292 RepID=A0ABQ0YM51_9NOCA|nr:M28 family peptidase [Rhodococcus aetherivorans]ETT28017.1 peptidase M28 [Rhodococcus rhodochrous ATCC 21198]NGP28885.1 M28 family peptidase [Rhodococcus aetherivorans]UGQ40130.1 M28 family peptidase [Rhodococcus aetherivorans]WKX00024.1 M28 family peptidase [Rhodococcus aetherivorans]GES37475.1 peptidase, M20/M25/M40 family [Rhodococcus aetherivorans]